MENVSVNTSTFGKTNIHSTIHCDSYHYFINIPKIVSYLGYPFRFMEQQVLFMTDIVVSRNINTQINSTHCKYVFAVSNYAESLVPW